MSAPIALAVPECLLGTVASANHARDEGAKAAACGLSRDCNPHPDGSGAAEAWDEGWFLVARPYLESSPRPGNAPAARCDASPASRPADEADGYVSVPESDR